MRSMLPILKKNAAALQARADASAATLDLLRDCGMSPKEQAHHEHSHSYLMLRLAAIQNDIAILERGYAARETRNASQ